MNKYKQKRLLKLFSQVLSFNYKVSTIRLTWLVGVFMRRHSMKRNNCKVFRNNNDKNNIGRIYFEKASVEHFRPWSVTLGTLQFTHLDTLL